MSKRKRKGGQKKSKMPKRKRKGGQKKSKMPKSERKDEEHTFKCVYQSGELFRVRIRIDGILQDFGSYDTPEEAAEAHDLARIELGHPTSKLNFPHSYPDYQPSKKKKLRSNNKTGFRGVTTSRDKKKFKACINVDGKQQRIGTFETKKEAAVAYDLRAIELNRPECYLNFPDLTETEKLKILASHTTLRSHNTTGFCGVRYTPSYCRTKPWTGRYEFFGQCQRVPGDFRTKYEAAWATDVDRLKNEYQVEGRDFTLNYSGKNDQERRRTYEKVVAEAAQKVRQKVSTSGKTRVEI